MAVIMVGMHHVAAAKKSVKKEEPALAAGASDKPGYNELKSHVEKLAGIDSLCKKQDTTTCYCEMAEQIRDEHDAIARLLIDDPSLRGFVIAVRQPASESVRYDLNQLPQVPDDQKCLSTIAAPTLNDLDSQEI